MVVKIQYEIMLRKEKAVVSYYRNLTAHQPDTLEEILALRPEGADMPAQKVYDLRRRMLGALVGRCAGCILGIPVEGYSVMRMQALALESGMPFPPVIYWKKTDQPDYMHYETNLRTAYLEEQLCQVPVDDDITYMVLNLLVMEKYGKHYSVEDVGRMWVEILPAACTAEDEALRQLRSGTKAAFAANSNEFVEWIGAAIRADAFGYAAAGDPATAARMSYNDAYLTHRQNGIYGEMFCAAAIAAAFAAKTPLDAVREGMKQIPRESELYKALEWAMAQEPKNYLRARMMIDEKFAEMHVVHTINNMCAIVFALKIGGMNYTKCISECVAMGLDNDCTGATVGSIVGACIGIDNIPAYWYDRFNDTLRTYLRGYDALSIQDVADRFIALND